jgi:hypothetical protein
MRRRTDRAGVSFAAVNRDLLALVLAGSLASAACARTPETVPTVAPSPRLLLADAAPAPAAEPAAPDNGGGGHPNEKKTETYPERDSRQLGRTWGWAAISIGAAAGVLALGTSGLMLHDLSVRGADCSSNKVCTPDGATANAALADIAPWNVATWVITAVGLGVGVYFLVTNPTDQAMGTQVGIVPNGSGATLSARGSF